MRRFSDELEIIEHKCVRSYNLLILFESDSFETTFDTAQEFGVSDKKRSRSPSSRDSLLTTTRSNVLVSLTFPLLNILHPSL